MSPGDKVLNSLAGGLKPGPEFQVLDSIVLLVTIFVMDALIREKRAPKVAFHNMSMFKDPPFMADLAFEADTDVPVLRDIASRHASEAALLSWASAPRPGKRVAVAVKPLVVPTAVSSSLCLEFAGFDSAVRKPRAVPKPPFVATATEPSFLVEYRSVAFIGHARVN